MSIYTKLNEAREKFHSLKLEKTGKNTFANYKYFELGDFLIPALKVFKECGLCAIVSFEKETASMTIVDVSPAEGAHELITITSPMGSAAIKGCHEVQNIGAVETYQRRYLWVTALEIVEHDAIDSSPQVEKEPEKKSSDRTIVMKVMRSIREHITNDRDLGALQEWEGACAKSEEFASDVWAGLTTPERDVLRAAKTAKNATKETA